MRNNTDTLASKMPIAKIGEEAFRKILLRSPKVEKFVDVRDNEVFQDLDIDFIGYYQTNITTGQTVTEIFDEEPKLTAAKTFDVKTDTMILKTGNAAFEVLTHGKLGSGYSSKAEYFVYCGVEGETVKKAWLIERERWKKYVDAHNFRRVAVRNSKGEPEPNTFVILTKIQKLQELGIAKDITHLLF